ncbi:MAG: hypothetical protein GYA17_13950, partial [Chloroflexi bacterium]|nr:hypothetical protein [Chloroflexota bacterium]
GSTGGVSTQGQNFSAGMLFSSMPEHPIQVQVMRIYYTAQGPWEVQWRPPAAPQGVTLQPSATVQLAPSPTPTLTPVVTDPLALQVEALARKFDAPLQQGPGWVHIVTETETNPRPGQEFPPPYLQSEHWYELDADGYVTRSVWTDRDQDGQVIQQSATVGNYSVNFTFAETRSNETPPYRLSTNTWGGVLNRAEQAQGQVTHEETTCENGRRCLIITVQDRFAAPVQNPGEDQPFYGGGQRGWIDLDSGEQYQSQNFWVLEGGVEQINSTQRTLLVERQDQAPADVLDVLSRVVIP